MFLKLAGPQLVQMFIGDGAKLVRDAFALAKEKAPAIIFIGACWELRDAPVVCVPRITQSKDVSEASDVRHPGGYNMQMRLMPSAQSGLIQKPAVTERCSGRCLNY